ncbi:response regulator transcription factor [Acidovorax sp. sic0104]|uniref:helix-turn-helix transcriptional regulator n=1 Tax=Acidovorax sp. sic0104 TaxID=2854784 RepID=UPI001C47DCCB|nr:response regulator transcription factor [Acidovorax sp. sic0104]MBV7544215.1 response regulator transcription factor [Acidovorax sp. sic0104]
MNHYLASEVAQSLDRWGAAFPQGTRVDRQQWPALVEVLRGAGGGRSAIVWLSTEYPEWPALLSELVRSDKRARVVVASGVPDEREALRAINEGARAYCHLFAVPEMLREVALVVQHGGVWMGSSLVARLAAATAGLTAPLASPQAQQDLQQLLSSRELEVARAVAKGFSNKEIADLLFISERTVKAHLGAAFEKLGVRDRVQLVLRMNQGPQYSQGPTSHA